MTTPQQRQPAALPPSPPPSPPQPRKRHTTKKSTDPFFDLANTPLSPSDSPPAEPQDSLLTKLFLTPLLSTSFLLSLFLVNRADRHRRLASHPPPSSSKSSLLSYFSPATWLDPEPYQDPAVTTWTRRAGSSAHVEPHAALNPGAQTAEKTRSWHLRKKIRAVARVEVSDALEMRGRVVVAMLAVVVLGLVGVGLGVRWMLPWWGGS